MAHPFFTGEFALRRERLLARATGRVLNLETTKLDDASLESAAYDTVVTVHSLCVAPDVDAAICRIAELLAPDGRILLLEHVRTPGLRGLVQDASAPLWKHTPFGCHPTRNPIADLRRHGFAITDCDRFKQPRVLPIVASHISAIAIRKVRPPMQEQAMNETGV